MKIIYALAIGMALSTQAFAWGGGRITGADCKTKCDCNAENLKAACTICCTSDQRYPDENPELDKRASGPEMDMEEAAEYGDNPSA